MCSVQNVYKKYQNVECTMIKNSDLEVRLKKQVDY